MQINQMLSQLQSVLGCKVALSVDHELYMYPQDKEALTEDEAEAVKDYKGLEIEMVDGIVTLYLEKAADISEISLSLAALYIKSQLDKGYGVYRSINNMLENSYSHSDIAAVSPFINEDKELYLIVLGGISLNDNKAELLEILKNSLNVKLLTEHQGNLVAAVEEQDILEACNGLHKNIMAELYQECIVAVGGKLEAPEQLAELYDFCLEAFELRKKYNINQAVLDYEGMYVYRLIASMDENLKRSITQRIFTNKFVDMLNSEMELTIEEMFRNNLNLTDTSTRLFIHRNTLLYRIDKIYKQTGFDLRKFEDSMVFKLAWLMYKEKQI